MRIPPDDHTSSDLGPLFRLSDPETSRQAAEQIAPHAATDRQRVLDCLQHYLGGLTDFELAEKLGGQQTSFGKRRGELVAQGLVADTGIRRPSPSGAKAIVWGVTSNQRNAA